MKAYRPVLIASFLVLIIGAILPLITLRSFEGYVQAWFDFLGLIAPAALLVLLLVLAPRLPPRTSIVLASTFIAIVSLGWLLGRVNILFFLLFLAGALATILSLQRTASANANAATDSPRK
jgi:hypothetical protein